MQRLPVYPAVGHQKYHGAVILDPRVDLHGFRGHRAHDLRSKHVAPGAVAATERAGAMGQPGLRWAIHVNGRALSVRTNST